MTRMTTVTVDEKGRLPIPAEMRRRLRLRAGDTVYLSKDDDTGIITVDTDSCLQHSSSKDQTNKQAEENSSWSGQ